MNTKTTGGKRSAEHVVKDIRRTTRRHFSSEDKIRIVLDGLRGEDSIAELCRKEGIRAGSVVSPDDADDPAVAFEALRRTIEAQGKQLGAEMTVIRRGVEAAFDQFERFQQPTDYGP